MAVEGVGEETATLLSLMVPMFRRYSGEITEEKKNLSCLEDASRYCLALLSGLRTEHFYVIALGRDGKILGRRLVAEGSLGEVSAYPRLVAETALNYNAASVILCHNHPGGSAVPSPADLETTKQLEKVLLGLDVYLLDHLVVAGGQVHSMMLHGELNHHAE